MKATKITVEYPTVERIERLTYKLTGLGQQYIEKPVNEATPVAVNVVKELTPEEMCMNQTGMTPSAYQARFKRAWNE